MKIGHFVDKWLPKSETFIYNQTNSRSIILTTSLIGNFPYEKLYSMNGLEKILFHFTGNSSTIKNTINNENISLIHSHFGTAGKAILKAKGNIPMVTSFYGYDCYSVPKKNPDVYRTLFEKGEKFLALGIEMKKELITLGCPEEKVEIHHLGVKEEKYKKRKKTTKPVFLSVARFVEKKGLEHLIQAFIELRKDRNCELRLVGSGPEQEKLESVAEGHEDIKFIDNLSSVNPAKIVKREMENANVFVLPSVTAKNGDKEGTPIVLMEASMFSLPCISTYHSDIPEIVESGKTGFLVKERDEDALYKKMKLLLDEKRRDLLGKAANQKMKREFSNKKQSKKLERIYKSLIN